jgi:hypothetical protein
MLDIPSENLRSVNVRPDNLIVPIASAASAASAASGVQMTDRERAARQCASRERIADDPSLVLGKHVRIATSADTVYESRTRARTSCLGMDVAHEQGACRLSPTSSAERSSSDCALPSQPPPTITLTDPWGHLHGDARLAAQVKQRAEQPTSFLLNTLLYSRFKKAKAAQDTVRRWPRPRLPATSLV